MARVALTPRGAVRGLTAGEQALAAAVFADRLDAGRVRLFAQPVSGFPRSVTVGPALILWPWRTALADFAAAETPLEAQAVFVHELTHVWQAQSGVNLLLAKLHAGDGPDAYDYALPGDPFESLSIERQAMVVQHAFVLARGGTAPYGAAAYRTALSAWGPASGLGLA